MNKSVDVLDSAVFRRVLHFKFFMVVAIWGLVPLLLPAYLFPSFGLMLSAAQIMWVRIWGIVVLLDTVIYLYIYRHPHRMLSRYLMIFAVADNGGLGLAELAVLLTVGLPWGIAVSIPIQLFFGYWFLRFANEGEFRA